MRNDYISSSSKIEWKMSPNCTHLVILNSAGNQTIKNYITISLDLSFEFYISKIDVYYLYFVF